MHKLNFTEHLDVADFLIVGREFAALSREPGEIREFGADKVAGVAVVGLNCDVLAEQRFAGNYAEFCGLLETKEIAVVELLIVDLDAHGGHCCGLCHLAAIVIEKKNTTGN